MDKVWSILHHLIIMAIAMIEIPIWLLREYVLKHGNDYTDNPNV